MSCHGCQNGVFLLAVVKVTFFLDISWGVGHGYVRGVSWFFYVDWLLSSCSTSPSL